jgi:hypothetical protein
MVPSGVRPSIEEQDTGAVVSEALAALRIRLLLGLGTTISVDAGARQPAG